MIKMPKTPKNTSVGTVAIAALVGGAAGALVSLMFAPKSGKALRQDIHNKADCIIEQVEDTAFQRAEALKQRSNDIVDKGKKLKEDIQMFIHDLRLKKPGYIDIVQSSPEETSIQSEPETNPPEFAPDEISHPEEITTLP